MRTDTVPTVFQQHSIPESIRSLSTMNADYVDLFTARTRGGASRSPEEWARAAVEDAAALRGQFVWRVVLGLRLEWRSLPDHVGGWKIAARGDRWLRLEAASWFLTAHIIVHVDDEHVSVATLIRYDRPIAALVWPRLSVVHRRAMPGLLRHAVRAQYADDS